MQSSSASSKQYLNVPPDSLSTSKIVEGNTNPSTINKFIRTFKPRITIPFSKECFSTMPPHTTLQCKRVSLEEEHIKAINCLSAIGDPLWKHVCHEVISMMGAASFLKIWGSTLGEVCSQDQSIEIHCQTEEVAKFIQQYDFVILGSLQTYFSALKQLRINVESLPRN